MSTMTVTTKITHKYLMDKTKSELAYMVLNLLDENESLINAWFTDERIQKDGSLRPSLEETTKRADKLYEYLNKIAHALELDWLAGDFPIDEALWKIGYLTK